MELGTGVPSKIDHVDVDSFFLHPTRPVRLSTKPQLATLPPSAGPHHLFDSSRHRSPASNPVLGPATSPFLPLLHRQPPAMKELLDSDRVNYLIWRFVFLRNAPRPVPRLAPTAQPSTTALTRPPARSLTHSLTHPYTQSRCTPSPVCSPASSSIHSLTIRCDLSLNS